MMPRTLFQLAGREPRPAALTEATLVLVDYQNEYLIGPLALPGAEAAVERAARLLQAARACGARIVHVAHRGAPGGLFDRAQPRGAIVAPLAPREGEAVVEKTRPNGFSDTDLAARIGATAGSAIVVAGFMTHNCVSSTVRAALDLGLAITVAGDACATRDLPAPGCGLIGAEALQAAELAALADRHAAIVTVDELLAL
ncbi:isochorismatase [Aureimonas endophytica]|uniref:Isochorismatase n=1 Tax=Aureimonas endophytica TaxID=2027858 RepID=A0A916ZVN0_9HYPH|nr:isochorismatase family protein [Aureimonas endophytica]GGE16166.1 isochorismatase [Aureimonas endophytica]